jgi:hypothetical protein
MCPLLSNETVSESRKPPLNRIKTELFRAVCLELLQLKDCLNAKSKTASWGMLCFAESKA